MFNLQILGRSVNVAKILAHSINNSIRKSIDVAIQRFENTSIHGIVVLDDMLNVAKLTHKLISRKLDLIPFDDMFNQVDDRLLQSSNGGRIVNHVIQEIADDLIPNSAYNSITNRFVEAGVIFVEKSGRNSPTKCQQMYLYGSKSFSIASATKNAEYSGFFGSVHFEIIKRVVGHGNFLMIASEITNHVDVMVKNTLSTYIDVIQKGSPTSLKLPIFEYGVTGAYEYFCAHLKPIIQYSDLSSEVFQTFREVGNAYI